MKTKDPVRRWGNGGSDSEADGPGLIVLTFSQSHVPQCVRLVEA
jgi:hypothetical protein